MDFRILGPVEARRDGDWIALSGSKVHTVLAAMLLAHGRVVSDSRLGALLWGWDPPVTASAQIYTYMSRLRKLLGDEVEIVRRQPGYVLRAPGARIDVVEFERLDRLGREALRERRFADAQALLTEALGWWRGPALSNVTEFLLEAELPQLEEARMLALENRIEADLALGMHEQVTAELTGLVAEHPVRERLRAQLMTALYRCGRQADALQTYYEGRKVLVDQLGVDPGEALGATYQAVLGGELGLRGAGAARGRSDVPTMLPAAEDGFVGRSAELSLLTARLAAGTNRPRRLLVTGMAGVGKTALAVRAAEESAGHFPDGQLFAELCDQDGTPKDAGEVLVRLLRALGEPGLDGGSPRATDRDELVRLYRARTSGKRLLVVLDDAVGDLQVAPLLPASPQAAVLITSRARLARVTGADTVALAPLDDDESLAVLAAAAGAERLRDDPDSADDLVAYCGGCRWRLPWWGPGSRRGRRGRPAGSRPGSRIRRSGSPSCRSVIWMCAGRCCRRCGGWPPGARWRSGRCPVPVRSRSRPGTPRCVSRCRRTRPSGCWSRWWTPRCSTSRASIRRGCRCTGAMSWSCCTRHRSTRHRSTRRTRPPPRTTAPPRSGDRGGRKVAVVRAVTTFRGTRSTSGSRGRARGRWSRGPRSTRRRRRVRGAAGPRCRRRSR
ncbi:BTAD domain-containing putative transcriptional regulator [Streptomyces sanglieri]|uniref:BTAD domain-containing putative transcriptional regulator n=1 Tax=Streptomyces sanglieri TaxID=193460 RepID=A0ABW2XBM2_9ACTN